MTAKPLGPYWCIAYRDDRTPCLFTTRSTRRDAWKEWEEWYTDPTPKDRARFYAMKFNVCEVAR